VNEPGALERSYRRLLVCYPRAYRREHGEEILAVLLACAEPGRRRPAAAEVIDLVRSGIRIRLQRRASRTAARYLAPTFPPPSSLPEPESYGQALRTVCWNGFRPAFRDWNYRGLPVWLRRSLTLVIAIAGASCLVGAYRYYAEDHPFHRIGPSVQTATIGVGRTIWVSAGLELPGSWRSDAVRIDALAPLVRHNSADASIVVETCRGRLTSSLVAGGKSYDAPDLCDSLYVVRLPNTVGHSYESSAVPVVFAITPHRAGLIDIAGVDVHVRQGWRRGTQHVGTNWTLAPR
jgi:hypothetical protein